MVVISGWQRKGNANLLFNEYRVSVLQNEKSSRDSLILHNHAKILKTTELRKG